MKYISGNTSEADRTFLNEILPKEIEQNSTKPKIFIHVSKNEHHYKEHVIPLLKKLRDLNYSYELDLGEYYNHEEVGKHFPTYLKKIINRN